MQYSQKIPVLINLTIFQFTIKKKSASKLYLLYNEPGTCVNVVKDRININYQRL